MNTKHILLTICTALSAVVALMGCAQKAKTELAQQGPIHYRIEGNIGRPEVTDTLFIREQRNNTQFADTIFVVNGEIVPVEGTLPEPTIVNLWNNSYSIQIIHILLTDGTTRINGTIDKHVARQSGTPLSEALTKMEEECYALAQDIRNAADSGKPYDDDEVAARVDSFVTKHISAHPNDLIGVLTFLDYSDVVWYKSPKRGLELLSMIDSSLVEKEQKLLNIKGRITTRLSTDVGAMFRDFSAEYEGKEQHLSDYVGRGQYVLVDFWAQWCRPCREENPNIVAAYNKYKDKGLQVLGVDSNDDTELCKKYISEQKIPYPQMFNVKQTELDLYGIDGIPHIILFGPDGTILSRDLRGDAIEKKLSEIFK